MSRSRHRKRRSVWTAGITAVAVGGAGVALVGGGSALAFGPWASDGAPAHAALASSTSLLRATPSSSASTTGTRSGWYRHHGHWHHGRPTARPTRPTKSPTTPASPTASPTSPSASPTTTAPTTNPTTPTTRPTTPTTRPTTTAPTKPTTPPTRPTTSTASPTTPSGGSQTQQYQAEVIRLVNVERAKVGCNALTANSALTNAAQAHAEDMLRNNYFSHDSQDGTSPFTRMTNAGYRWSGAAENIAAGQRTPADVMNSWMNSAGHKANILNCGLKDIGVGYAAGSGADYGQYWVQDFGSPA